MRSFKISKETVSERKWSCNHNIKTDSWLEVFSACLGKMMAVQDACSDFVVKDSDWNVDFLD